MNHQIRIIHIIDHLSEGGRERRMVELLKELSKYEKFKIVAVILKREAHYTEIFNIPNIKIFLLERKTKKDIRIFFKLFRLCKDFKPDIIHTWSSMSSLYVLPIVKWFKIKLLNGMISNANCVPFSSNHLRAKVTFLFSDLILSNSTAGAHAYNVPARKSKVIPNGFNFSRIEHLDVKDEVRNKFNIRTKYVIGMVGSVDHRKDYKTYIRAAIDVLLQRDDISFLIIGSGNQLNKTKAMVPKKFASKILFLGRQKNVESIINIFDIGVLTTYTEGISNAIMEYMALGKPVIATKGGGTEEIIVDNQTGFVIDHASKIQLAEKILFLLNNREKAKQMGELGKKRIMEEFGVEKMVRSIVEVYGELLQNTDH